MAAKLLCVFSTLAASVDYHEYVKGPDGTPVMGDKVVTVKGGAGVANDHIQTPRGVATMVSEAQAEMLKGNSVFQLHRANGFVTLGAVDRLPGEAEVEKAVADLEGRDNSAPLVPQDFTAAGQDAPVASAATPKAK